MVIECTECHARFKLADDKVKPGGTKVRCSKCKHIFTVMPPAPEPPLEEEIDFGEFNMERLAEPGNEPPPEQAAAEPAATGWNRDRAETEAGEFSFGGEREAESAGEFSIGPETETRPEDTAAGQAAPEEFSFGGEEETAGPDRFALEEETEPQPATAVAGSETSDEFAFDGEEETEADEFAFGVAAETQPDEDTFGFEESEGFSFDEDQEADEEGAGPEEFSFDTAGTTGSVEFDFDEGTTGAEAGAEFSWDEEEEGGDEEGFDFKASDKPSAEVDEFDFSGMTFGEEESAPTGPVVETERLSPAVASSALLETELLRPQREVPPPRAPSAPRPEPHPAVPPASRRRKSPIQGLMLFIGLLLLAMTGAAVYFYWQGGIPELTTLIDRLTGQTAPPQVSGQIRIEGLTSLYVANQEAGQLLVIQGKATNDYPETRSSLAVKGVLFNKEGKALVQQTVFCGNPLDQETLKKLPYAKIEESMNNPFGESLSNLNVAPGKTIPFTIVFRNLPADLAEFTVEATDSKPGTQQ